MHCHLEALLGIMNAQMFSEELIALQDIHHPCLFIIWKRMKQKMEVDIFPQSSHPSMLMSYYKCNAIYQDFKDISYFVL